MPDPTPLRGAVFDFGGVVVDGPFDAFTRLERRAGVPAGSIRAINARNPDDNAWARIERGEIDAAAFAALFADEARALGLTLPVQEVLDVVTSASHAQHAARPAMLQLFADLRAAGVRTAVLTNNIRPLGDSPDARWVFQAVDVVVESVVVGMRKPEPGVYRLVLDALGVEPAAAVMLDDLGINLKPARALGMHTVKVAATDTGSEAAATAVRQLLL